MFAKHLPPSAALPRVLALDPAAAAELAGLAQVTLASDTEQRHVVGAHPPWPRGFTRDAAPDPDQVVGAPFTPNDGFDAVVGTAPPEVVPSLAQLLRPGGRLILAASTPPEPLLAALTTADLIHCLVEPAGALTLYRGECPPVGDSRERHARLAAEAAPASTLLQPAAITQRYIFVLVAQTPNKPAWRLTPGDHLEWHAATVRHPAAGAPALLAFSGLVRAVAFMQSAVLAGAIKDVNKVGKFPAEAAQAWGLPVLLNPNFEAVRGLEAGPPLSVDPAAAVTGEE